MSTSIGTSKRRRRRLAVGSEPVHRSLAAFTSVNSYSHYWCILLMLSLPATVSSLTTGSTHAVPNHHSITTRRITQLSLVKRPQDYDEDDEEETFYSGSSSSSDTALAIVPPDSAWDRLQRARHVAGDKTYRQWPPALRLFHPFPAAVLDVANVISEYEIEPFEVCLNQWSILPDAEAMQEEWEAFLHATPLADPGEQIVDEERAAVEALISYEEEMGRKKLAHRFLREGKPPPDPHVVIKPNEFEKRLQEQQRLHDEFNGPCVICLEPDKESAQKLRALRELLLQSVPSLEPYAHCSPTASVSSSSSAWKGVRSNRSMAHNSNSGATTTTTSGDTTTTEYRPVVPIAAKATVTEALETAKKLKRNWGPSLRFPVTDLHVLGLVVDDPDGSFPNAESSSNNSNRWMSSHNPAAAAVHDQYGCHAMIMLMGNEVPQDDALNEEMARLILERGEAGGGIVESSVEKKENETAGRNKQNDKSDNDDDDDDGLANLEQWLEEEDDDFDEGTVFVIGRTHFFTGEMRQYVGMPAVPVTAKAPQKQKKT